MELNEIDPNKTIVQHNAITSGRYDFSACQMDVLFMILALLDNKDAPNKPYSVFVKDIEAITGRKWNYQQLAEATEDMGSRMFSIKTPEQHIQLWLFQSIVYKIGKGYFDVKISEDARPYLFDLKNNFTVLQLKSALTCSSKYAKRLYALCCQWRTRGDVTMTIDSLKEMLFLKDPKGKDPEQFKMIFDFKRFVLDIAKEQINELTDIKFEYELIKRGRSFTHIKIFIGKQKPKQIEIDFTESIEYQKKVATIMAYGINEDVAKQVAIKHFAEFIAIKDELNANIKSGKVKVENARAYIVGILKNKKIIK
jgi:plasmid replication initiation protein